jgi:hypothetical protein
MSSRANLAQFSAAHSEIRLKSRKTTSSFSAIVSALPSVCTFRGQVVTGFAFRWFPNRMIKEEFYVSIERAVFSLGHFRQLCREVMRYSYWSAALSFMPRYLMYFLASQRASTRVD